MSRSLLILVVAFLLDCAAYAQCFEPNLGMLLGTGDDVLFPVEYLGIDFRGFSHARVSSNGVAYLTNSSGSQAGIDVNGYSTSAGTMVTNLRGAGVLTPRIAPYWRDLDIRPTNDGGVYLNNAMPGKCVLTWLNAVHFGQAAPVFTVQAQLFATGEIRFSFSGSLRNTEVCPLVGVNTVFFPPDPGATDLSVSSVGVSTRLIVYETFATPNTFDLHNTTVSFMPNAAGGYDVSPSPCVPAITTHFGAGCYSRGSATFYESFDASTFDLANSSIRLTRNSSGGYTAGSGSTGFFTHTIAGLGLTDDSLAAVTLPSAFTYPGGSTTRIAICSNGYIWMRSPNTLIDYTPTSAELLLHPARLCPLWSDLVPDGATNVDNVFAEADTVNNKFYVTWRNCQTFTTPGTATCQVEFDLTNGAIEYRYRACSIPAAALVGWTAGAPDALNDPGNRDISATVAAGFSTSIETRALALSVAPTPVLGRSITYTTRNIPATAPLSVQVISFDAQTPGLDLTAVGIAAPGCQLLVQFLRYFAVELRGNPMVSLALPLPTTPSLVGRSLYGQTFSIDPPSNPAGILSSNGVRSVLNTF